MVSTPSNAHTHRSDSLLAHSVVCEFDVSLVIEENVVQLEVAVDDAALVEEVQGEADLGGVEPEGSKTSSKCIMFSMFHVACFIVLCFGPISCRTYCTTDPTYS